MHYQENKTIQTVLFTEMILELFGASMVMKSKSPKLEPIMGMWVGHNIDSWAHLTLEVLGEVHYLVMHSILMRVFSLSLLKYILGFQVFSRNCANCHGMIGKKYDLLLEKVYEQI